MLSDKIEVVFRDADTRFSSQGIAAMTSAYEQASNITGCRAYAVDALWATLKKLKENELVDTYSWFPSKPVAVDKALILLEIPSKAYQKQLIDNFHIVNELEEKYGVPPSSLHPTQRDKFFVVQGDAAWVSEVWKYNMYTGLITSLYQGNYTDYYGQVVKGKDEAKFWSRIMIPNNGEILQPDSGSNHGYAGIRAIKDHYNPLWKVIYGEEPAKPKRKYVRKVATFIAYEDKTIADNALNFLLGE